jgi:uncharacterized protein (TIGR03437 family)
MRSGWLLTALWVLAGWQAMAGPPRIAPGGIRNAASFEDPALPGGDIARGAMFTVFGQDLGPEAGVHATAFPLPEELSGVRVTVLGGEQPVSAYLLYVSATQINAILPSHSPLEKVRVVVSYLGEQSEGEEISVTRQAPAIFTVEQNGRGRGIITNYESPSMQPLNSAASPARRGQVITIWATGLGAIGQADNQPPGAMGAVGHLRDYDVAFGEKARGRAEYAGRSAEFAGLDQVNVVIPPDAPTGCATPVRILDRGMGSNTVTMAITESGEPCVARGKTYYLDCGSGNDANDGLSPASAWGTLVRVNGTVFEPGDAILLKRGTHCPLQLYPKGSGTAEAPIRVGAYGSGPLPVVQSSGEASVKLFNQEYWRIENIEVAGGTTYGIFVSGDVAGTLHGIEIVDVVVRDVHGALTTKNSGGIVVFTNAENTRFDGVLVDGATVYRITQWAGIHVSGARYPGRLPDRYGERIVVRNSVVHDVYGDGILLAMNRGGLMEKNVTWNTGMQPTLTIGTPSAMWFWFSEDSVVQFNEGFWSRSPEVDAGVFDIDWTQTRGTIQYNYGHDSDGYCVSVFGANWTTSESVVRYNVCARNGLRADLAQRQGAIFLATWDGGSLDGVKIHNNTVIWDPPVDAYAVVNRSSFVGQRPNLFANNVIVSTTPRLVDSNERLRFNHNLYFYTGTQAPLWKYGNATYTSWEAYRAGTGQDARSLFADPKLEAPGYHLPGFPVTSLRPLADSPVIDAGMDVGEMGTRDFFGQAIPAGGGYDIGASEFAAEAPRAAPKEAGQSGKWSLLTLAAAPCAGEGAPAALRSQRPFLQSAQRQFGAAGLAVRMVLTRPSCAVDSGELANLRYDWALDGVELVVDEGGRAPLAMAGGMAIAGRTVMAGRTVTAGGPVVTLLVNPEGRPVARWEGFVPAPQLGFALQRWLGSPRR